MRMGGCYALKIFQEKIQQTKETHRQTKSNCRNRKNNYRRHVFHAGEKRRIQRTENREKERKTRQSPWSLRPS